MTHFLFMITKPPLHLPAAINRLLNRDFPSERALAVALDVSHSNLRQVLAGQRCSAKILARLLGVFPAADDYWLLVSAHLLDEATAVGVDVSKLVVRPTDGITARELRLSVVFEDYLGVIARRLQAEAERPEPARLISQEIEWLARVVVEFTAREADAAAVIPPAPSVEFAQGNPAAAFILGALHAKAAEEGVPRTSQASPPRCK